MGAILQLSQDFGYSEPAIRRFVSYYDAIDYLQTIAPDIVTDIFTGKLILSIENIRSIIKRPLPEIRRTIERIKLGNEPLCVIFPERAPKSTVKRRIKADRASVKDMPIYDPDAQVTGLAYTIPSWVTAMERVFMSDHLQESSMSAQKRLLKELSTLSNTIDEMLELLQPAVSERNLYENSF